MACNGWSHFLSSLTSWGLIFGIVFLEISERKQPYIKMLPTQCIIRKLTVYLAGLQWMILTSYLFLLPRMFSGKELLYQEPFTRKHPWSKTTLHKDIAQNCSSITKLTVYLAGLAMDEPYFLVKGSRNQLEETTPHKAVAKNFASFKNWLCTLLACMDSPYILGWFQVADSSKAVEENNSAQKYCQELYIIQKLMHKKLVNFTWLQNFYKAKRVRKHTL